ncbi:MAG TPA: tRNA (adenosine(37)-N6)-threonylcarbamoyltransferase complex ATPase subunit type 1 TsaE [Patescibacteria group bacterium]|jgi:tRNA threonylcarbamoyladenosine biosynthesis protein TsaE|nr:tRNA (adenosine(37)-N6)-threonylcarbamoyltransferase complex ATPase subunit type 1 TsaE [Patescibacteria group bacterium]
MPVMNTDLKSQITSTSSSNTERIAAQIGKNLHGGEVIELVSDLGGGKTVFVKGLASGAGSKDDVTSPTFTISKIYNCSKFAIHHFDFYRLSDPGVVALELKEVMQDPKIVVAIEWANIVDNVLPADRLRVEIAQTGNDSRILKICYPANLSYLIKGVNA